MVCSGGGQQDSNGEDTHPASPAGDELTLYPNPAGPEQAATLAFGLAEAETVQVQVYDLAGKIVWSFRELLQPGGQELSLPSGNWEKGIYLVRFQSPGRNETLKLVLGN